MKRFAALLAIWMLQLYAISDPLPVDETVKMGQLPNGLTYYIQENGFPKGRASLRLVVKAGSFHEDEDQQGLAHFLEHMVFRGSKHFQDWEIINYLESIGAKFGADTNAATGFENTTYILEIPLEKEEVLDRGILILSDFAGRAMLDSTMIDREREVIMDEYNLHKKSPAGRIMEKYLDHFFHGSLYTDRQPIGKKEIIRSCDPELIRKFYRKWYRPDRMAVVAVGDFDSDVVESYIKEHFYDLEKGGEELNDPDLHYNAIEKSFFILDEPEASVNMGGFVHIDELPEGGPVTNKGVKKWMINEIFDDILNKRLNRASKKNPPPFLSTLTSNAELSSYHSIEELLFFCFEDRPLDGLKAFYEEVSLLKEFGPTEEEWNEAIEKVRKELEDRRANLARVSHIALASKCMEHFLQNSDIVSVKDMLETKEEILGALTIDALVKWAKAIDMTKYHAIYITPKKDLVAPSKIEECLRALEKVEWVKPALEKKQGWEIQTAEANTCKMPLVFHPTDLEKQRVKIELIAKNGVAAFPTEWYPSVLMGPTYLSESGFASLDGTRLHETLAAKDIGLQVSLDAHSRTIAISGPSEHEELMFQLIRAIFCEKRFSQDAWNHVCEMNKEWERNRFNNPYLVFLEKATAFIHSNHPLFAMLSVNRSKEEWARKAMEVAFNNPEEFTMIAVGDFDQGRWKELANRYLSFSPSSEKMREAELPFGTFPKEGTDQVIHAGKESHCYNIIAYQVSFTFNERRKTTLAAESFVRILEQRLYAKLRQECGDTYGVKVINDFPFAPNMEELFVYIIFTSEPEKSEKLKSVTLKMVQSFANDGPTDEEIAKDRELHTAEKNKAMQSNNAWINILATHTFLNTPLNVLTDEHLTEKEITKENIHALAQELLKSNPVKLTLLPEIPE